MIQILLSDLAVEQLSNMSEKSGRKLLEALQRLRTFPESAPVVTVEGYESYRQLVIYPYRTIYRYLEDEGVVRVYCIVQVRRSLPGPEFLKYQIF